MDDMNYEKFDKLPKYGSKIHKIILYLLEQRPMRVVGLAKELNLGRQTVYYYLRKIKDEMVYKRKANNVYWVLNLKLEE